MHGTKRPDALMLWIVPPQTTTVSIALVVRLYSSMISKHVLLITMGYALQPGLQRYCDHEIVIRTRLRYPGYVMVANNMIR